MVASLEIVKMVGYVGKEGVLGNVVVPVSK